MSLANRVLIEVPIVVHPIPIYAKGVEFRSFAAGPQPIGESDECDKKLVNAPFTFQPLYPTFVGSPPPPSKPVAEAHIVVEVPPIPNGACFNIVREVEQNRLMEKGDDLVLGIGFGHVGLTTVTYVDEL